MYILLRSMKVQKADGSVELRHPGDKVPEAENFPNPSIWVKRGYMRLESSEPIDNNGKRKLKTPSRTATAEDIARGSNAPVPKAGEKLPGYKGNGSIAAPEEKKEDSQKYSADDLKAMKVGEYSQDDLKAMKVGELREMANETFGIAASGGSKKDLIAAILEAQDL